MQQRSTFLIALSASVVFAGAALAQSKGEIVIGEQCDRTGPTQLVGNVLCPAVMDYANLINSKGGVEGFKIVVNELDNQYQVPPAIEEYERQKQMGMVSTLLYGTPQTLAPEASSTGRCPLSTASRARSGPSPAKNAPSKSPVTDDRS